MRQYLGDGEIDSNVCLRWIVDCRLHTKSSRSWI